MSTAVTLLQADDGGYVVTGTSPNNARPTDNAWIMKLDAAGNVAWRKLYDSRRGRDEFVSVQRAAGGGYVVTGSIANGYRDTLVLRLDGHANVIWARTFDGVVGGSIWAAGDGYIVKGLYPTEQQPDGTTWVAKIDDGGSVIWQKAFGTANLRAIRATIDGGYLVAGWGSGGALLMKLDASGDIAWQRVYGGATTGEFADVRPTLDGGCVVMGRTRSSGNPSALWLLKLDAAGRIEWQKIYGQAFAIAMQPTTDGGYVVQAANTSGPSVMKIDGRGNNTWLKSYGNGLASLTAIEATTDGGYLVGGGTWGIDTPRLLKLNADGTAAGCAVTDERTLTPIDSAATETVGTVSVINGNLTQVSSTVVLTDVTTVTQDLCPVP